jgi:NAD+ synthase
LWAGQTDENELGFTYVEVDQLLYLLVDQRYTPADCVEAGFAEKFVQAVVRRIQRNQFKRVLPPIAKLSHRTIGYDFLYLRDWGT